jgi:hypothetical protein
VDVALRSGQRIPRRPPKRALLPYRMPSDQASTRMSEDRVRIFSRSVFETAGLFNEGPATLAVPCQPALISIEASVGMAARMLATASATASNAPSTVTFNATLFSSRVTG